MFYSFHPKYETRVIIYLHTVKMFHKCQCSVFLHLLVQKHKCCDVTWWRLIISPFISSKYHWAKYFQHSCKYFVHSFKLLMKIYHRVFLELRNVIMRPPQISFLLVCIVNIVCSKLDCVIAFYSYLRNGFKECVNEQAIMKNMEMYFIVKCLWDYSYHIIFFLHFFNSWIVYNSLKILGHDTFR